MGWVIATIEVKEGGVKAIYESLTSAINFSLSTKAFSEPCIRTLI